MEDTSFRKPVGPVVPKSYPRVVFRIIGESKPRFVDFSNTQQFPLSGGTQVQWMQSFVDLRCRALVKIDGYNPETKECGKQTVISKEVDYFYCDHPEVKL